MLTAVPLALLASLLFAVAFVLQQQEAFELPDEVALRPRILLDLARQPVWLGGVAASVGGYVALAIAMNWGRITVVEPILVANLLFALPMSAARQKQSLRARDWGAAVAATVGLAGFLVVARPHGGVHNAPDVGWAFALAAGTLLVAIFVLVARRTGPTPRAVLLAIAAGLALGATDALTKEITGQLQGPFLGVFTGWQLYALIVAGVGGLVLVQSAFQAGHIAASLPSMLSVELFVASAIGLTLFDEHLRTAGFAPLLEGVAIAVLVAGIVGLATSPLVAEAVRRREEADRTSDAGADDRDRSATEREAA